MPKVLVECVDELETFAGCFTPLVMDRISDPGKPSAEDQLVAHQQPDARFMMEEAGIEGDLSICLSLG